MTSQLDLGEVALADGLEQAVVAHVRLLRLFGAARAQPRAGRARAADFLSAIAVRGRVLRGGEGDQRLRRYSTTPAKRDDRDYYFCGSW